MCLDTADFGLFISAFIIVLWSISLDLHHKDKLTTYTIIDMVIIGICLIGLIYEAIIA